VAKNFFFWAPWGRFIPLEGNPSGFSYRERRSGDIYKEN